MSTSSEKQQRGKQQKWRRVRAFSEIRKGDLIVFRRPGRRAESRIVARVRGCGVFEVNYRGIRDFPVSEHEISEIWRKVAS